MDGNGKPTAKVMLLGVFHFKDSGLDGYKPQHDIDILSSQRQQEVVEIVACLANFKPTKIAVERRLHRQEETDIQYSLYRQDDFELLGSEDFQLGFRLAARLEHDRVYCVDAFDRYYDPPVDMEAVAGTRSGQELNQYLTEELQFDAWGDLQRYAQAHGQGDIIPRWLNKLQEDGKAGDEAKMHRSIRETLLEMNIEKNIWQSHDTYFNGPFRIGVPNEYPGVDYTAAWYTRNLRIFANIQRITEESERILVIFGRGHMPILRHCIIASSEYDLVEVHEYLG